MHNNYVSQAKKLTPLIHKVFEDIRGKWFKLYHNNWYKWDSTGL